MDGVNARFDFTALAVPLASLGRTHLIAIGGAGMSAVARLLLARGVPVSGSDARDSATLAALADAGARVFVGHDAEHVREADTVVVSSAIRDDNVELTAARDRGLLVLHRAQALASAAAGHRVVAIAGANGKTTTTSMLVAALESAGLDPSFAAGGELAAHGTNARYGGGDAFVVEADESDGSFVVYHPQVAVVTNVQPDHLDFYGSFARVQDAYADFVGSSPRDGLLVACADDPGSARLAATSVRTGRRVLTYGTTDAAQVRVLSWEPAGLGSSAVLRDADGTVGELIVPAPGVHNIRNAVAAYTAAVHGLDADADRVLAGLAGFRGTRRRFEVVGTRRGVLVVDDYAHNPGKVEAVVGTAAALAAERGGRLCVLFQPHLYSRTRDFAAQFAAGLAPADRVGLLAVYGAREAPVAGVDSELIGHPLRQLPGRREVPGVLAPQEAARWAVTGSVPGDIILLVGAGDIGELASPLLAELTEQQ